uniref:glutamate synthase (NADH) n=1 Tax=Macrostomum lignano TaxID=282301 RepID=A0A1I8GTT7_9PLAT
MAALLGADEFGFSTAPLIVLGCTLMRKCHLNTCPVGIATQDPILRKKFAGQPEHVINYMFMLAEEVRGYMAKLGFRSMKDMIGRVDKLRPKDRAPNRKPSLLTFDSILYNASAARPEVLAQGGCVAQEFRLEDRVDFKLIEDLRDVIESRKPSAQLSLTIGNKDRAFGSTLSWAISKRHGETGLPEGSISLNLTGHAGQSFCAFLTYGVSIRLEGDACDYVAKGLSGGRVVVVPPASVNKQFASEDNIIVGNVCLYGAVKGIAMFRGQAAERFCVRNSGALAVCEGCGDHGCEYMTGGTVIILGPTGRNFAAGMSGGIAYIYDIGNNFRQRCNKASVDILPVIEPDDLKLLRQVLTEFVAETGSQRAQQVLNNFDEIVGTSFLKVFPHEFQRVLKEAKAKPETYSHLSLQKQSAMSMAARKPLSQMVENQDIDFIGDIDDEENEREDELVKTTVRGFVKYPRAKYQYKEVQSRADSWDEIFNHSDVQRGLRLQSARCMDCGIPFCQSNHGCPLGNIIPRFNDLVFRHQWQMALETLLQTNNFPEFTGRVCPAPCEAACCLGINAPPVTIKDIENTIIEHAFEHGWIAPEIPPSRTGRRIAVVGSGPSGLACAAQLNKAGHLVTIFERNTAAGGLLRYGIPSMKLSKAVVERRVALMEASGIEFRCGVNVGNGQAAAQLLQQFDAICLCTGATWPRDIPVPGRNLNGIHFAMSFLENWQKTQSIEDYGTDLALVAKDKDIVVLGGGDTGVDCLGTALRQGARSLTTFEILPEPPATRSADNPWPQWPKVFKRDYGHEEVKLRFGKDPGIATKEFIDDGNGNVAGVKTCKVNWTKDVAGRWVMSEVPDTEQVYKADLVLLAMGFLGPEKHIVDELNLQCDPRSNIEAVVGSYRTSVPRVYAAGDCRRGQSLVVHAINEGRQAAREIDYHLMGRSYLAGPGAAASRPGRAPSLRSSASQAAAFRTSVGLPGFPANGADEATSSRSEGIAATRWACHRLLTTRAVTSNFSLGNDARYRLRVSLGQSEDSTTRMRQFAKSDATSNRKNWCQAEPPGSTGLRLRSRKRTRRGLGLRIDVVQLLDSHEQGDDSILAREERLQEADVLYLVRVGSVRWVGPLLLVRVGAWAALPPGPLTVSRLLLVSLQFKTPSPFVTGPV